MKTVGVMVVDTITNDSHGGGGGGGGGSMHLLT